MFISESFLKKLFEEDDEARISGDDENTKDAMPGSTSNADTGDSVENTDEAGDDTESEEAGTDAFPDDNLYGDDAGQGGEAEDTDESGDDEDALEAGTSGLTNLAGEIVTKNKTEE